MLMLRITLNKGAEKMTIQTKEVQTLNLDGVKPDQEKKCSDIVEEKYQERLEEFERAKRFFDITDKLASDEKGDLETYLNDEAQGFNNYSYFFDYVNEAGLGFSRVEAGTFEGQRAGYWRWQLSWGGPSQEFRLFDNNDLEFWHLDWFDGAKVDVEDEIFQNIMENFKDLSQPCD